MEPSLSVSDQVALLVDRGLTVGDKDACVAFLTASNYFRFSGYARYFQKAPHRGDDSFRPGVTFDAIKRVYDADESVRITLVRSLAQAELLLRTHVARVIADSSGPYGRYLEESFYTDVGQGEPTVESCRRDIKRSKERHILRFTHAGVGAPGFANLPVWSAVEAWSFGTLSKCVERGDKGALTGAVAASLGIAKAGFAYRVRALVYLRNRCAHHGRLWQHSVIDAGPTPNNVRNKAKRLAGQFGPRSTLDVVASLDDFLVRGNARAPVLQELVDLYSRDATYWRGLVAPESPRDNLA